MGSKYRNSFFASKREWSKYKDAILGYYLTPYLQKVKEIKKPICIVDMCAGRGEFETGEQGSPLIIAEQLSKLSNQGFAVKLRCYENHSPFYHHLKSVLKPYSFAEALNKDCFSDVDEIARLASSHTIFLYIDPCDVVQLSLSRLKLVFDMVRQQSSVEALMIFMARAFMRQASLTNILSTHIQESGVLHDPLVRDADDDDKQMWLDALYDEATSSDFTKAQKYQSLLTDIAGGEYWMDVIKDTANSWEEKCSILVDKYLKVLRSWFKIAEAMPVCAGNSKIPKYWIVFTSRFEPAFDLFNRAACEMTRSQFQDFHRHETSLFSNIEIPEDRPKTHVVDRTLKRFAKRLLPCTWEKLRWSICGGRNVGKYTDSEINQSIKRLIKSGWIVGSSGDRIENAKMLSPTEQLNNWIDRH